MSMQITVQKAVASKAILTKAPVKVQRTKSLSLSAAPRAKEVTVAVTSLATAAFVFPQIASAAQEIALVAEGEPLIAQIGWASLAVSFTVSIAMVIWGRSGL